MMVFTSKLTRKFKNYIFYFISTELHNGIHNMEAAAIGTLKLEGQLGLGRHSYGLCEAAQGLPCPYSHKNGKGKYPDGNMPSFSPAQHVEREHDPIPKVSQHESVSHIDFCRLHNITFFSINLKKKGPVSRYC